jgi:hypothetical protein
MIKEICRRLDPDRYFVESSPDLGAFPNDPQGGNTHGYTNMWFVPGYDYLRFATEDTRISAPGVKSLERFMRPEDIWPEGHSPLYTYPSTLPWPESWMEYTGAISERKTGPVEEFYDADSAEELVWRLGAASGVYYRRTIEKFRQGRPADRPDGKRNAEGYIIWKLNDSWPQLYSGKVDYFLEPYIAYYYIRRAYRPLALSFDIGSHIHAWVANDTPEDFTGELVVGLFDMTKNVYTKELRRAVTVKVGDSLAAASLDEFGQFERYLVLSARLYDLRGDLVAECCDFAEIERRLLFPEAELAVTVRGDTVTLTTDKFARAVELSGECGGDKFGWVFEDNYFDLLPGEVKTVRLLRRGAHGTITAKGHYSPHSTRVKV